jgi:hypothetical protein
MTLVFLVCVATDFAAGDARAFGQLWGAHRTHLCARDMGDTGTFPWEVYEWRCTLHAARCILIINTSPRFAALFPFLDCPAYPLLSLPCLILPPTHPLRPPAAPPLSIPPIRAFPRSHTNKN